MKNKGIKVPFDILRKNKTPELWDAHVKGCLP